MAVNRKIVAVALLVMIGASAVAAYIHISSLDPNCPYCDIAALNKYGGTLEYMDGSEDRTFVLEAGYHRAEYAKADVFSVYHEEEYREMGHIHYRKVTDVSVNGPQIVKVTVNEQF